MHVFFPLKKNKNKNYHLLYGFQRPFLIAKGYTQYLVISNRNPRWNVATSSIIFLNSPCVVLFQKQWWDMPIFKVLFKAICFYFPRKSTNPWGIHRCFFHFLGSGSANPSTLGSSRHAVRPCCQIHFWWYGVCLKIGCPPKPNGLLSFSLWHGGFLWRYPIAGWFVSWKILSKNWWWLGVPPWLRKPPNSIFDHLQGGFSVKKQPKITEKQYSWNHGKKKPTI